MRFHLPVLLVCSIVGCSGSNRVDPALAEAREVASRDGAPALVRIASALGAERAAALAAAQPSIGPSFVFPTIEGRVAALDVALDALAGNVALAGSTLVALSSDGSAFTSEGSVAIRPFSRPFSNVPCVTLALSMGRSGRCHDTLLGLREPYEIFVEPIRVGGAVVGALVALETRASIARRVRDSVRATKSTLASIGVCLKFESDEVCVDVPEEARRAASDAATRQPNARRRTAESASIGGALVASDLAEWPSSALVFVHLRASSGSTNH